MVVDNFECILEGDKFLTQQIHGVLLICVDNTKEMMSAVLLPFPEIKTNMITCVFVYLTYVSSWVKMGFCY